MPNDVVQEVYESWMQHCFQLAALANGPTSPNPLVGAVVINAAGTLLGTGYHRGAGSPHAEVHALEEAGEKAKGATLIVNLEPCSHYGRTGPCVDKVIESGIKTVVAAMQDPNPLVSGQGFQRLAAYGIEIVQDICREQAIWLNRGFVKRMSSGYPWLILKLATTLDGKLADQTGLSRWITGEPARAFVHRMRSESDCILIGAGTVRQDNPSLDVRYFPQGRSPKTGVVSGTMLLPKTLKLFGADKESQTTVFCADEIYQQAREHYPANVEVISVDTNGELLDLKQVLKQLAQLGNNYVLCEGGSKLATSLIEQELADELFWLISPQLLFDRQAKMALSSELPVGLQEAIKLRQVKFQQLGNDFLITGLFPWTENLNKG